MILAGLQYQIAGVNHSDAFFMAILSFLAVIVTVPVYLTNGHWPALNFACNLMNY